MIYAVTGAGPRTGTSWTMEQLEQAGLPVYYSEYIDIPGAAYETYWKELPHLNQVIAKVWPAYLLKVPVSKMVVLSRNHEDQVRSLQQQIIREQASGFRLDSEPEKIIQRCKWMLSRIKIPRLEIRTEDLNQRIDEIIEWLSVPFEAVESI